MAFEETDKENGNKMTIKLQLLFENIKSDYHEFRLESHLIIEKELNIVKNISPLLSKLEHIHNVIIEWKKKDTKFKNRIDEINNIIKELE